MDNFNSLKEAVLNVEDDCKKFFEKGNKSAGTRLRKAMQEIKRLAQAVRTDVQNARQTE